jgi:hypothetical protein
MTTEHPGWPNARTRLAVLEEQIEIVSTDGTERRTVSREEFETFDRYAGWTTKGFGLYSLTVNADGGNFKLQVGDVQTDAIAFNANAGTVATALHAILGAATVVVQGLEDGGDVYRIVVLGARPIISVVDVDTSLGTDPGVLSIADITP